MKTLIKVLKVIVPLGLGIYLAWYSFHSIENKDTVGDVLSRANYFLIFISIGLSWLSHYLRAKRWSYLLEPMGYKTNTWNNYHAVMIGYFLNLLLPRAGEVSRAGMMTRYEKVPFDKGFGSILAERVVDVFMLGMISLITIFLQYDKFLELWKKFDQMKTANPGDEKGTNWFLIIVAVFALFGVALLVWYFVNATFRNRVNKVFRGLLDGLLTILRLKKRLQFIALTVLIWALYIGLYLICFYSIDETSDIPLKALMLGFLGGSIGIIFVQGGIGVYPILVASALSLYNTDAEFYDIVIGLGWVVWSAQTFLLIIAGAISFYLMPRMNTNNPDPE